MLLNTLNTALLEEENIWSLGYDFEDIIPNKARAYFTITDPPFCHWNVVYPLQSNFIEWTKKDIEVFTNFYKSLNTEGYYVTLCNTSQRSPNEYFYLNKANIPRMINEDRINYEHSSDMDIFSNVLKECFGFSENIKNNLKTKIECINKKTDHKHIIFKIKNEIMGTASVFKTKNNNWFSMNLGVLPKYRGHDFAHKMALTYPLEELDGDIYTHTDNPFLRNSLLQRLNFTLSGSIKLVKL